MDVIWVKLIGAVFGFVLGIIVRSYIYKSEPKPEPELLEEEEDLLCLEIESLAPLSRYKSLAPIAIPIFKNTKPAFDYRIRKGPRGGTYVEFKREETNFWMELRSGSVTEKQAHEAIKKHKKIEANGGDFDVMWESK